MGSTPPGPFQLRVLRDGVGGERITFDPIAMPAGEKEATIELEVGG
jgi:hypothetical protein